MKTRIYLTLIVALWFLGCKQETPKDHRSSETEETQTPVQLGRELFEGKGNCYSCHKPDQKIIGPSLQEIAKIYKAQNGDIVNFLKGNGAPLVDPSQYEVMKTNFAITKNMTDEELQALEAYIYSFK
ncbi:MAG: cytochrome C552 [Flavobacterium sp. BFFFF1]|uniref:c-type cytochrome n=1 Tax=unclassified Flavobacterium TaxID=196869 RepID=UPI000BD9AE8D|nr:MULTISPECIES: c-type cytochrome [unclassified Flavobacterium]OYU80968.1 MAG: cytochrome C552 [Flavobacterium sp. BFFFF1]